MIQAKVVGLESPEGAREEELVSTLSGWKRTDPEAVSRMRKRSCRSRQAQAIAELGIFTNYKPLNKPRPRPEICTCLLPGLHEGKVKEKLSIPNVESV